MEKYEKPCMEVIDVQDEVVTESDESYGSDVSMS